MINFVLDNTCEKIVRLDGHILSIVREKRKLDIELTFNEAMPSRNRHTCFIFPIGMAVIP